MARLHVNRQDGKLLKTLSAAPVNTDRQILTPRPLVDASIDASPVLCRLLPRQLPPPMFDLDG